mmetsp:Transcript_21610/g.30270  ORF Transcript_21610/g.30270 Transcript_21610/m.30270 type:complete len:661 (-) Transcript_21610:282-2264(-)|eukprot:CAMPEP_0184862362 /NCGR_PEP_ID=MMETSP0580-20130426/6833_1 /TAXON_ID=1118495 /ORGANISM="Dactyliosolen fragilissimus" /LENGTH=660 /DNA_ID=CAMNT_0027360199 /DNA_START=162 /DNA_END=2144 /DNA_ORIENTATION=+
MSTSLTVDSIERIVGSDGKQVDPSFMPVVQVLKVIKVEVPANSPDRYRAILSDGKQYLQGMLATQHNHMVTSGQMNDLCVIRLKEFMSNIINDKIVLIVFGFDVLNSNVYQKIGNPVEAGKRVIASGAAGNITGNAMNSSIAGHGGRNNYAKKEYNKGHNQQGGGINPYSSNSYPSSTSSASNPIVRTNGAMSNTASNGQPITPIGALNMYQNRWTIKARVTTKGDIRTWSNSKGEGTLFSVTLLDASGTDIKATFFKEAVDKFHPMLQEDQVYSFSGGRLKMAQQQYNTCKSSFEITFDQNSEIHLDNDTGDIQQQIYEFIPIQQLETVEPNSNVDLLAIVKNVSPVSTIVSKKSGNEIPKAELTLLDNSGAEVSLTVWGDRAAKVQEPQFQNQPIVAFRKVKVSDYGGRSLSASSNSNVTLQPRVPELQILQKWWHTVGKVSSDSNNIQSLTNTLSGGASKLPPFNERKSVSSIKQEHLGHSPDKPDWVSFKGTFNFIKSDKEGGAWYTACANADEPCKNRYKVTQTTDGLWQCDRCNQTRDVCMRKFIFSATVADDTSTTWVSLFDEQARVLLQPHTADELHKEFEDGAMNGGSGQDLYNSAFAKANFTDWIFTCKVKQEMVQDEVRVKTSVYALHPVDYAKEGRHLLDKILEICPQ